MKQSGLYIHVPYCRSKCIYCDFYSGGASCADWQQLTKALLKELHIRRRELKSSVATIYIGGGTPSLIPCDEFRHLVNGITLEFGGSIHISEFTIEVNPEDVTEDKCRVWRDCGVNRVSMGCQSFVDSELLAVKRRHNSKSSIDAYGVLREYFDNISIDLMYGLPGQSVESWRESVSVAMDMRPEHLSAYSLMFEEGTDLSVLRDKGRLNFPNEDECLAMWRILSERLRKEGYCQYEISNYALPGKESVHNSRYWYGNPYLGLGPSAHSYDGIDIRRSNPNDLKRYLSFYCADSPTDAAVGNSVFYEEEHLSKEELAEEMLITRMRLAAGMDTTEYEGRFGILDKQRLINNARPFIDNGDLIYDGVLLKLSHKGIMVSDEIILALSM